MTFSNETRWQLVTVAYLRWRMFINGLRTRRGKTELVARGFVGIAFGMGAVLGASGMGSAAWYFVSQGKPEYIAGLLWAVFLFWQLFPITATAFTNNPDATELLRFPLSYRSYYLVRLAYGALDPATALGSAWLFGILLGISIARPAFFPWAALALLTFAIFNLLLMQMIFAWVERWLAQRRTREIIGVLFVLLMLSFQLLGPAVEHFGKRPQPELHRFVDILAPIQRFLPPGLASNAIFQASKGNLFTGLFCLLLLASIAWLMGYLLHLRLRAQFRGENLSGVGSLKGSDRERRRHVGWAFQGLAPALAAVVEKELRYVMRSGPVMLTLITPIFMISVFRLGGMNRGFGFAARAPAMAFPVAAGYALLVLTNLIYNNFGSDAGGIQFFYASPVRFSQIVLAKNLSHVTLLLSEVTLAWVAVAMLYGIPSLQVTIATATALLFAVPVNLTIGNLLSLYSPKRLDFSAFGRQRASQTTVFASLGVQIVVVGLATVTFWLANDYGNLWIATSAFLVLSLLSVSLYLFTLRHIDALAGERREALLAELCRA
jgi:ABC-2 type transport system permease protein